MDELDELAARAITDSQVEPPQPSELVRRVESIRARRKAGRTGLVTVCLIVVVGLAAVAFSAVDDQDQQVIASSDVTNSPRTDSWGPLATVTEGDGSDGALVTGTLRIQDDCVLLDEQGTDVLLVWPSDRTGWDAEQQLVLFQANAGWSLGLRDGDEVTFGGGGTSIAEGGETAAGFLASVNWVSEPEPQCVADSRWFIGDLVSPDGAAEIDLILVPEVRGLQRDEAIERLVSAGLGVEVSETSESDESSAGEVLATDPAAGAEVAPGTTVKLTVATEIDTPPVDANCAVPSYDAASLLAGLPIEEVLPTGIRSGYQAGERVFVEFEDPSLGGPWFAVAAQVQDMGGRPLGTAVWLVPDPFIAFNGNGEPGDPAESPSDWGLYAQNSLARAASIWTPPPTDELETDPSTRVATCITNPASPLVHITGMLPSGDTWILVESPSQELCLTMSGVNYGCDGIGPVIAADDPPYTPRTAATLRPAPGVSEDNAGELMYAFLPDGATTVRLILPDNSSYSTEITMDLATGLWAGPIEVGNNPSHVEYLDDRGELVVSTK